MASGNFTLTPISKVRLPPYPGPREKAPSGWSLPLVPDFSCWELGDIVLIEATGFTGAAISVGQHVFSPSTHAGKRWSHCGIYSGNGHLIDATPTDGISERSIADYCIDREIAVVRLIPDARTPVGAGAFAQAHARARIGDKYAWDDLLAMVKAWGKTAPVSSSRHNSAYCSALVVQCYGPVNAPLDTIAGCCPCLPSTLSQHPWLSDLQIEWRTPI